VRRKSTDIGGKLRSEEGMTMSAEQAPPNHFDRSKPFYPLVTNYALQFAGFKELAVRATLHQLAKMPGGANGLAYALAFQPEAGKLRPDIKAQLEKLGGPLELRSDVQNCPVIIEIDDIGSEVLSQGRYLLGHLRNVAGWSLLIVAHEISRARPWHSPDPLWEFLRHCRHAAAHGGTFAFRTREPRFPAKWGGLEITRAREGSPVLASDDAPGLLWPGDLVRLLWDIEQAYPQMKA
jgi:hypothetical protein